MADGKFRYVESLATRVASDPALQQQLRDNPVSALQNLAAPPLQTDPWIYRIVVSALGLAVLGTILSAAILAGYGKAVPEGVIAIGSAAAGALAGLLAPSPVRQAER